MKTFNCSQGSNEWAQLRLGVVTASEADTLLTNSFKARVGEGVETYLYKKLAEKTLGWSPDSGGTFTMDQGNLAEKIALPWFNFTYNADARPVGFCLSDDGRTGCSPDALIGDDNGLEIKFPTPPIHLKYLLNNQLPPCYAPQVHFSMFVTGRPKWTFLSFSRHFPSLVVEVKRDEAIQEKISSAVNTFFIFFDSHLAKIKAMTDAENALKSAAYEASLAKP
jgi:hypothetical protein